MPPSSEPELTVLRKLANDLAQGRKERITTGHLLAAMASQPGLASGLLGERKLSADVLLKAARANLDEEPDPIARSMTRAREVAARMGSGGPTTLHLLLALLHDRKMGAHRALSQCGVDVSRLRSSAMQLALGRVEPRRTQPRDIGREGVRVPVIPHRESSLARTAVETSVGAGARSDLLTSARRLPGQAVAVPIPAPVRTFPAAKASEPRKQGDAAPRKRTSKGDAATIKARESDAAGSPAASQAQQVPGNARFELDAGEFPTLVSLGKNLTLLAAQHQLEPAVARDRCIDNVLDVLAKKHARNPVLLGPVGVGKTSIVRGLAARIAQSAPRGSLDDRIVIELSASSLLSGTGVRGALAERVCALRNEVQKSGGRVVLFFDDLHLLLSADGADEAITELKASLGRGELSCIGATTREDFRRHIENDAALARRFTVVEVEEPSAVEALPIVEQVTESLGTHHAVSFDSEATRQAVQWSVRYLPGRCLPEKAIGILDLAGARVHRRGDRWVRSDAVAQVVSDLTEVPVERLLETDHARMLKLESILSRRVVGHQDALARIARVLRRNAAGFSQRRPVGTFLLLGPTGVGKTECAKGIAEALFHHPDALTRLDMGEYSEAHAVARLIGSPPGYIGHEAGGHLTEAVRRRPYQVVLLDEIEKAHPEVLQTFLAVFDEGRLTDGRGRTVDLTNTVIVLTSNLGARELETRGRRSSIGFGGGGGGAANELADVVIAAARAHLPPELYNRIDEVIPFAGLTRDEVGEIARRLLARLGEELAKARGVVLEVAGEAIGALLDAGGFDPELGARPMKRSIGRLVEAPIAEMILRGELTQGGVARVTVRRGVLNVEVAKGGNVGLATEVRPDPGSREASRPRLP